MPLEDSPSLQDFADGMPPPAPDPGRGHRVARAVIVALSVILGVLLVINVAQSRVVSLISGSGTITGTVVNANGVPTSAEIIIERTERIVRSDASGRFELQQVPAGPQLLVVAFDGVGVEYPITAVAGASVNIGTVQAETTAVPLP
ncbi:carboxypeptidase-like regulatory domain-containing protein [Oscillochloris sp. ZM17-4]|uniref:carboxypeptidase-like regulatory domain-containing protein n=1 Tax=Oscillochloris sp. ZM17-4 TaxID=2866714 RepID=UPI001C72FBAA|nr:carboxypeptidase-like regulatory domain-containing protein [Oscillochloris sp. ZM17-4]MBX0326707.1 carboxypeptidase-like regulatory domain-containing protein [Oscillochloris sp. ZM17-4]